MKPKGRSARAPLRVLGWREWAQLPHLNVWAIKAKLDTGARTSVLHAFQLRPFARGGVDLVRFEIHPIQRSSASAVEVEMEVHEHRVIRNSGGHEELRPVVLTEIRIGDDVWPIELTLTSRDEMGFRMLLGRQALRGRVVVDPGSSFRGGPRPRHVRRRPLGSREEE